MDEVLGEFMARHKRVALMFSAGKDSAACLRLARPYLQHIIVVWVNPGRPYPEVRAYMDAVKHSVPRFVEVKGDQPKYVKLWGYPADQVPWEASPWPREQIAFEHAPVALSPAHECRWVNMWRPALEALREMDVSGVIRGEKLVDRPRPQYLAPVFEGREHCYPLLQWSDEQVFEFIADALPPGYAEGLSGSLDCMTCTAFLARNPARLLYLRRHHPKVFEEIVPVLRYMRDRTSEHLKRLEAIGD